MQNSLHQRGRKMLRADAVQNSLHQRGRKMLRVRGQSTCYALRSG